MLRAAAASDREAVRQLHLSAFPLEEQVSVAELAVSLLDEKLAPPALNLLTEDAGDISGHVAFSPVSFASELALQAYIMAPLAVAPASQKQGLGKQLVEEGMHQLAAAGVDILFVYGDPDYYGRFGFAADTAELYEPPFPLQYPFGWQAVYLNPLAENSERTSISCVEPLNKPGLW